MIDPNSADNSICWMRKEEFDQLKSKDDWRDRFAVWANWNSNGEFVTYTVPPGKPLKVWEGETASSALKDLDGSLIKADDKGNHFWTAAGGKQTVLERRDSHPGERHHCARNGTELGKDQRRGHHLRVSGGILGQGWWECV